MSPNHNKNSLDEIVLEAAQPNIFQINAFRVLELSVDSGEMEINKRRKMIEISQANSTPLPPGSGRALPLDGTPDGFVVADSVQRLRDPERRFIDEFFWFWPQTLGNSREDEALAALREGDEERAVQIWTEAANNYSVDNVSVHNLAVLAHARALDLELSLNGREPTIGQSSRLDIYWKQALKRYQSLLKVDPFWARLEARVRDFDDPILDSRTVQNLRAALPQGLLLINARMAAQAAEREDKPAVERHLNVMKTSGFEPKTVEDALLRALDPLRQRLKTYAKSAEERTNADPAHADKAINELLDNCQPILRVIGALLPMGSLTLQTMRDDLAQTCMQCAVTFGNKTESWGKALLILERVQAIASSPSVRDRVQQNMKQLKDNIAINNDWHGDGYFDLPANIINDLEAAYRKAEARDWDGSLRDLEGVMPQVDASQKHLVHKAMAYAYNGRAQDCIQAAANSNDRRRMMDALKTANDDLLRAQECDPNNRLVTDNLSATRRLGIQMGVSLPSRPSGARVQRPAAPQPARPAQQKPQPPRPAQQQPPRPQSKPAPRGKTSYPRWFAASASLVQHFFAGLVDAAGLIGLFLLVVPYVTMKVLKMASYQPVTSTLIMAGTVVVYYTLFHAVLGRRTIGERLTKSEALTLDGAQLNLFRALLRSILFVLPLTISLMIGNLTTFKYYWVVLLVYLLPALNSDRRGFHDFFSGSVLRKVE